MKHLLYWIALIGLTGCAATGPVELSTEGLGTHQIATLNPISPHPSVLMRIDGRATGNCFTNCAFFRPVRVPAGKHKVRMVVSLPSKVIAQGEPVIPENRLVEAKKLAPTAGHLIFVAYSFALDDQDFTFEGGKTYQLKLGFLRKDDAPYVWWEMLEPR